MFSLPFLFDRRLTSPFRHVSVTSDMALAHRPIAWIVAAANSLSELVTYVFTNKQDKSSALGAALSFIPTESIHLNKLLSVSNGLHTSNGTVFFRIIFLHTKLSTMMTLSTKHYDRDGMHTDLFSTLFTTYTLRSQKQTLKPS